MSGYKHSAFTQLEFNKALANLQNIPIILSGYESLTFYELDVQREDWDNGIKEYNPYENLNYLIPAAYRYGAIEHYYEFRGDESRYALPSMAEFDNFIDEIRLYLWNVAAQKDLIKKFNPLID